jgi:outer membrane lipoprotein SlyB
MKQYIYISAALLLLPLLMPSETIAASIQYGIVTSITVTTVEDDDGMSGAAKGALIGGMIGPRRRGINRGVIAGAAVGAAADDGDTETVYLYTVNYVDGSGSIKIQTEQGDIRDNDCVSIERGEHANIRRVSNVHCEQQTSTPPDHHTQAAVDCDQAKQELKAAETDEELEIAIQKARILCED